MTSSEQPFPPSESEGENATDGEESESQPFEESEGCSTRAGESESESVMEPEEEAQYEQDASAGLSPRKVLKRACAELVPESALPAALSRQDTMAHFEAAVSAPDGPQYVSAPIEPGMDRTLSTSSTTATAALSGGAAAQLSRIDTFGQMEDASRAAAERGRGGGHGGSALRPRAAAVDGGGGADDAVPLPLAHSETLRALPAVAAALSAVDDADGPTAMGAKPIARTDTMELLQSVDDDTAGAAGGGAEEAAAPRDAGPPGKIARVS